MEQISAIAEAREQIENDDYLTNANSYGITNVD